MAAAWAVESTMSVNKMVASTRSTATVGIRPPLTNSSIAPRRSDVRQRPVVGTVALDEPRAADVLGEVPAVPDADELVVAAVDHERRHLDQREDVPDVELEDGSEPASAARTGVAA